MNTSFRRTRSRTSLCVSLSYSLLLAAECVRATVCGKGARIMSEGAWVRGQSVGWRAHLLANLLKLRVTLYFITCHDIIENHGALILPTNSCYKSYYEVYINFVVFSFHRSILINYCLEISFSNYCFVTERTRVKRAFRDAC